MPSFPWHIESGDRLCGWAELYNRIVQESIFDKLGPHTTPEQYEEAQGSLLLLHEELLKRKAESRFHFPYPGGHRCTESVYLELASRLKNRQILARKPLPGAPRGQDLTPEEVAAHLAELLPELVKPNETFVGEDGR